MASTVKTRPNYYEILGLAPRAGADAIARAFARESNVLRPHAFGVMAEICLAYETLRDPARRRAYDASIGLEPEPFLPVSSRPISAHFMAQPAVDAPPPALPLTAPEARPQTATPPPEELSEFAPGPRPEPEVMSRPLPPASAIHPISFNESSDEDTRPIGLRQTGLVIGGLVAAAVLIGALAGWWSGSDAANAASPGSEAAAPATKEKRLPTLAEIWSAPDSHSANAGSEQPVPPTAPGRKIERRRDPPRLAASDAEAQLIQPPADVADPTPADSLAPEPAPAPAVTTSMPLPHQTVARTLDRIGYRCGSVASATPVDGATGVYRVTCTSGQSFQAKPVNGRYRFRRLANN